MRQDLACQGPAAAVTPRNADHKPVLLAVGSLFFLALLPMFIQSRIAASLDELSEMMDPASTAVSDMQVALAQEAAGTSGFLLTGDEFYATSHHNAQSARRDAYAGLVNSAAGMKPEFRVALAETGQGFRTVDELVDGLYSGKVTREQFVSLLPVQQARFQAVTAMTARLQQDIRQEAATRRERIRSVHRIDAILSLVGALLVFGAVTSVLRLSSKHRALADRERKARAAADRAVAEAERHEREIARISASRRGLIRGFSHDVKNPLGAADGYLFMLERGVMGPITARQGDALEHARHSVKAAIQLIQDLLDLARAETGDLDLHPVTTDPCEVALRTVEDYRAQGDRKGLVVFADLPAAFPVLQTDPARVGQILGNLMGNAIKYTEAGSVGIRVGLRADDTGREWCVIDVSDTGPGIAEDDQRLIFDEFKRLDVSSGTAGAGVGLSISKRLAGLLGGHITVDSDLGRGSRFTLWLPFDVAGSTHDPATIEGAWVSEAQSAT